MVELCQTPVNETKLRRREGGAQKNGKKGRREGIEGGKNVIYMAPYSGGRFQGEIFWDSAFGMCLSRHTHGTTL